MDVQCLRGGEAGGPVEYTVARVFGGSTAAARRVDSRQDERLLTTATVSFAAELPGPEHGHRSVIPVDPATLPPTGPAGPPPPRPPAPHPPRAPRPTPPRPVAPRGLWRAPPTR